MTVYIIRAGDNGPVKIGWSAGPAEGRMATLQAGSAERFKLLREMPGTRRAEAAMHLKFAAHRIDREWFHFHPDMLTATVNVVERGQPYFPVIERLGGIMAVSRRRGLKNNVIRMWVQRGRIPGDEMVELMRFCEAAGLSYCADDFTLHDASLTREAAE